MEGVALLPEMVAKALALRAEVRLALTARLIALFALLKLMVVAPVQGRIGALSMRMIMTTAALLDVDGISVIKNVGCWTNLESARHCSGCTMLCFVLSRFD